MPRYSNNAHDNIQIARPSIPTVTVGLASHSQLPSHHVAKSSCALTCGRRRYFFVVHFKGRERPAELSKNWGKYFLIYKLSKSMAYHLSGVTPNILKFNKSRDTFRVQGQFRRIQGQFRSIQGRFAEEQNPTKSLLKMGEIGRLFGHFRGKGTSDLTKHPGGQRLVSCFWNLFLQFG